MIATLRQLSRHCGGSLARMGSRIGPAASLLLGRCGRHNVAAMTTVNQRMSSHVRCASSTAATFKDARVQTLFDSILDNRPHFRAAGSSIVLLDEPAAYYHRLKASIQSAQDRIVLSSLYLGGGDHEQQLVDLLAAQLDKHPDLHVTILLDCIRGQRKQYRGEMTSVEMLRPLVEKFGVRAKVHLFHTPDLKGVMKKLAPPRYNETSIY
eukprot:GFYU01040395.1.p1 GENE.GFYU01040395.1~~GFYU01040395.1.p1  ORF type:complete len:209 (+),score=14.74 GFYU01040395.1:116-742(+)